MERALCFQIMEKKSYRGNLRSDYCCSLCTYPTGLKRQMENEGEKMVSFIFHLFLQKWLSFPKTIAKISR